MNGQQAQVLIDISRYNLQQLSMHDLAIVMDAITAARDAVNGVECQPRCRPDTDVWSEISSLQDGLNDAVEMIADIARTAQPSNKTEATIRAVMLVHYESKYYDEFFQVEELVASLSADMAPFKEA